MEILKQTKKPKYDTVSYTYIPLLTHKKQKNKNDKRLWGPRHQTKDSNKKLLRVGNKGVYNRRLDRGKEEEETKVSVYTTLWAITSCREPTLSFNTTTLMSNLEE